MSALALSGLGDLQDCGTNPCTWWDNVYLRDACLQYKTCVNPNDPMVILANRGLIVGGAQVVGSTVGGAVGTGVESTVEGIFSSPNPGSAPTVNWALIAFVGVLAIVAVPLLLNMGRR